jgi:large subunit ribosomal protein L3
MQGLIGKKIGMTRIFNQENGTEVPITVIHAGNNIVTQLKTTQKDKYSSVQLGYDFAPEKVVTKPRMGHFKKHNAAPTRHIKEFKLDSDQEILTEGQTVGVEVFENIKFVDVVGITKGRGHTGTIKRYNFQRGRETHGNTNHRERGSSGANTYPARVLTGMTMSGQYGNEQVTVKGLKLAGIDKEAGLLFVHGAIPGFNKGIVFIKKNLSKR